MASLSVFIIHSKALDVRKQRMDALKSAFENASFSVEYIDEFNPSEITHDDISKNFNLSKTNSPTDPYDGFVKNMHVQQISNALKHKHAIFKASRCASDYCLVLEDDVLHGDDIAKRVNDAVVQLSKSEADLLFLGLPSLLPIDESKENVLRKTLDFYRVLPCCDSYLASRATMKKLYDAYGPIRFVTNIQLSAVCEANGLQMFMTSPNIFLDGSKYGVFLSSVDPNGHLLFNPDHNKLVGLISKGTYTLDDRKMIEHILENIKFKNHPDIMHLEAQYLIANKNYSKAETILENVLTIMTQNGCIINTDTAFLRTHMGIYKHLQQDVI